MPSLRAVVWAALLLLGQGPVGNGFAQTNAITHSPAEVVEKYVMLDNKGVRLDAASFVPAGRHEQRREGLSLQRVVARDSRWHAKEPPKAIG